MNIPSDVLWGVLIGAIGALLAMYFQGNFNARLSKAHEFYMRWGNIFDDIYRHVNNWWIPTSQQVSQLNQLLSDPNFGALPADYQSQLKTLVADLGNLSDCRRKAAVSTNQLIEQRFHGNTQRNSIGRFTVFELMAKKVQMSINNELEDYVILDTFILSGSDGLQGKALMRSEHDGQWDVALEDLRQNLIQSEEIKEYKNRVFQCVMALGKIRDELRKRMNRPLRVRDLFNFSFR